MTILDAARQELSAGIHSQALRPNFRLTSLVRPPAINASITRRSRSLRVQHVYEHTGDNGDGAVHGDDLQRDRPL